MLVQLLAKQSNTQAIIYILKINAIFILSASCFYTQIRF